METVWIIFPRPTFLCRSGTCVPIAVLTPFFWAQPHLRLWSIKSKENRGKSTGEKKPMWVRKIGNQTDAGIRRANTSDGKMIERRRWCPWAWVWAARGNGTHPWSASCLPRGLCSSLGCYTLHPFSVLQQQPVTACISLNWDHFTSYLIRLTQQRQEQKPSTLSSEKCAFLLNCDNLWQGDCISLLCLLWEGIFLLFSHGYWRNKDYHI